VVIEGRIRNGVSWNGPPSASPWRGLWRMPTVGLGRSAGRRLHSTSWKSSTAREGAQAEAADCAPRRSIARRNGSRSKSPMKTRISSTCARCFRVSPPGENPIIYHTRTAPNEARCRGRKAGKGRKPTWSTFSSGNGSGPGDRNGKKPS